MQGRPQIVATRVDHEPVLRELLNDADTHHGLYPMLDRRDLGDLLFDGIGSELQTIVVEGEIVGAVGMVGRELVIFIGRAFQRRGIATESLARYLEKRANGAACDVRAHVARSNAPSRRLLTSAGFTELGLHRTARAREPLIEYWRSIG